MPLFIKICILSLLCEGFSNILLWKPPIVNGRFIIDMHKSDYKLLDYKIFRCWEFLGTDNLTNTVSVETLLTNIWFLGIDEVFSFFFNSVTLFIFLRDVKWMPVTIYMSVSQANGAFDDLTVVLRYLIAKLTLSLFWISFAVILLLLVLFQFFAHLMICPWA